MYIIRNHSIAATFLFRRLQYYPNVLQLLKNVHKYKALVAACQNTRVFAKISFFIYSLFLSSPFITYTLK